MRLGYGPYKWRKWARYFHLIGASSDGNMRCQMRPRYVLFMGQVTHILDRKTLFVDGMKIEVFFNCINGTIYFIANT